MRLTKHHGLGNDFLVLMDLDETTVIDPEVARRICHRRHGVGADGLIRCAPGSHGAAFTMDFFNSDGSTAEMSGNGMRCLVQAIVLAGANDASQFLVSTGGGVREVSHRVGDAPGQSWVSVDMGATSPSPVTPDLVRHQSGSPRTATLEIGNPHVVLLVENPSDLAEIDVAELGPGYENQFPFGANVEWITPTSKTEMTMRVWERGAGATLACGTGACASARVAHDWGLMEEHVSVTMPGGSVDVTLGDTVVLSGPASYVGAVDIDPGFLVVR